MFDPQSQFLLRVFRASEREDGPLIKMDHQITWAIEIHEAVRISTEERTRGLMRRSTA